VTGKREYESGEGHAGHVRMVEGRSDFFSLGFSRWVTNEAKPEKNSLGTGNRCAKFKWQGGAARGGGGRESRAKDGVSLWRDHAETAGGSSVQNWKSQLSPTKKFSVMSQTPEERKKKR